MKNNSRLKPYATPADAVAAIAGVLDRCTETKPGRQWDACCPAHEDRNPSFAVGLGDSGKALLYCQAGCSPNEIVAALSARLPLGLAPSDLFPADPGKQSGRRELRHHDYRDAGGRPLFRKIKYADGNWSQRRLNSDGTPGEWSVKGVERVLYRLPELLAADPTATVVLTEGEKDAEAVIAAGFVATSPPDGAGKWRDGYTAALRARDVVIAPHDDKAGREHAAMAAGKLAGVAASVRVVRSLPDGRDGTYNDVADFFAAGMNAAAFKQVLDAAGPPEEVLKGADGGPTTIEFITSAAFAAGDFAQPEIIPGVLTKGEPGQIVGPMKACKTTVAVDLTISVATGTPFLGRFEVPTPRGVGLVSAESGKATLQETALRVAASKGVDLAGAELAHWAFHIPALDGDDAADVLIDTVHEFKLELLILDPLYLALGSTGNEGNVFEMGERLKPLGRVCSETGATVLLCHHARKNREDHHAPLQLHEIAYAGSGEWMRQWLFLSRRAKFDPESGRQELWLGYGGSCGNSGEWALDIEEGRRSDPGGRVYGPSLALPLEAKEAAKIKQDAARDAGKRETLRRNMQKVLDHLSSVVGDTRTGIKKAAGLNPDNVKLALEALMDGDEPAVMEVKLERGGRDCDGYALAPRVNG